MTQNQVFLHAKLCDRPQPDGYAELPGSLCWSRQHPRRTIRDHLGNATILIQRIQHEHRGIRGVADLACHSWEGSPLPSEKTLLSRVDVATVMQSGLLLPIG